MIKRSIQQKDIKLGNIYTPNTEARKYIKQTLTGIKGEIYSTNNSSRHFNTPSHKWIEH